MIQTLKRSLSLDEFLLREETKPASEYIQGQILQKPMPQGQHSILQGELVTLVNLHGRPQKLARAFPELRCTFGERSIVPDITVLPWCKFPRTSDGQIANSFESAPDWVIEILSPGQSQTRFLKNILHCLDYGCELGWLIIPSDRAVWICRSIHQIQVIDFTNDLIPLPVFVGDWSITIEELFNCLSE